jgi:hypothetical protein
VRVTPRQGADNTFMSEVSAASVKQLGMGGSVTLASTVEIPLAGELNGGSCLTEGNTLALCSNGLHYKA